MPNLYEAKCPACGGWFRRDGNGYFCEAHGPFTSNIAPEVRVTITKLDDSGRWVTQTTDGKEDE